MVKESFPDLSDTLIVYDRDGVLIEEHLDQNEIFASGNTKKINFLVDVQWLKEFHIYSQVKTAIATNQPDVGRGKTSPDAVNFINCHVADSLAIERVYCCTHDDLALCSCRKPKPGLLIDAISYFKPRAALFIGDRKSDIDAGNAAEMFTGFISKRMEEAVTSAYFFGKNVEDILCQFVNFLAELDEFQRGKL